MSSSSLSANSPHAIVIGGGFGGLAAAVRLGALGYRVTLCEGQKKLGGRAYVVERDGFVFDTGPTVVTVPHLLEELWTLCGKRMSDHVDLIPVNPFYAVVFEDGSRFDFSGDDDAMRAQITALAPGDLSGYDAYLEMSRRIFNVGFEKLSAVPFDSWWSMAKIAPEMMRLKSYKTVYGLVSDYIENEKLRQVLSFHTLLVGGNPFTTTSIYALVAYVEQRWGVHFPRGGVGSLITSLADLVRGQGGEIRLQTEVEQIVVRGGRAVGVRLKGGEELASEVVVSNADMAHTYKNMVPKQARKHWTDKRIDNLAYSMSLFVWYFGTKRTYPEIDQHTILLGPRYRELIGDIFDRGRLADDFSLYLHRPTATDPSLAPEGHDGFYVLSPVPHLKDSNIDWETQGEAYRRRIEAYLEERLLPGLSDAVVTSFTATPNYYRDTLLSLHGAAFAMQPILKQSAYFRPHNQSEDVDGLYLVGAGTHPGAGLPGVLSSAKVLDKVVPHAN